MKCLLIHDQISKTSHVGFNLVKELKNQNCYIELQTSDFVLP